LKGLAKKQEIPSMCDYSLHSVRSRAAKAGDQLVVACFAHTSTRGFASLDEPTVAVCLRPGTELVFDKDVAWGLPLSMFFRKRQPSGRFARFRQINMQRSDTHHDAIEFPNGEVVLLTSLRKGQKATVIQLPAFQYQHDRSNAPAIVQRPDGSFVPSGALNSGF
jgi:hypothetical protein